MRQSEWRWLCGRDSIYVRRVPRVCRCGSPVDASGLLLWYVNMRQEEPRGMRGTIPLMTFPWHLRQLESQNRSTGLTQSLSVTANVWVDRWFDTNPHGSIANR